jgi:hypothetical protein
MRFVLWERRDRKTLLIAGAALLAMLALAMLLVDVVPAGAKTLGSFYRLREAVILHALKHNALPDDFAQLDFVKREPDRLKDEWGRQIEIEITPEHVVTLRSLGSDGKPGGIGAAADIVGAFRLVEDNGKWGDPSGEWLKKPMYGRR